MAEGKKSFILYAEWLEIFEALTNEQAGKLTKHILRYVNDENPINDDQLINVLFIPIKQTLKRDLKKWERQQEQRREAGKKSAEVRKRNKKIATSVNERSISSTVNVNVNDITNSYIKDLKNEFSYLEGIYRTYKLEKGSITQLSKLFIEHLKIHPKIHQNFSEFKKHFANWIGTLNRNNQLEKYKTIRKGAL